MIKIKIIAHGTLSEKYWQEARNEYIKRLRPFADITEIELKEHPVPPKARDGDIAAALEAENAKILAEIPPKAVKIAMCIEGKQYSSEALAAMLSREASMGRGEFCFIIGSSHGLSPKIKQAADIRLSMSEMTFPHQLARIMLYEAIYRSTQINHGSKYHK